MKPATCRRAFTVTSRNWTCMVTVIILECASNLHNFFYQPHLMHHYIKFISLNTQAILY